ncbi:hypothetical protein GCM10009120_00950 [Sphingobacterium siyangense subsp. cladoniae]|uniref:hypothetical protein n=1 Tax=Sphingobacterium siyangense TaxID=459529 RepID=UPI0031F869F4
MNYYFTLLFLVALQYVNAQESFVFKHLPQPQIKYETTGIYQTKAEGKLEGPSPFTMNLEGNNKVQSTTSTRAEIKQIIPYKTEILFVEASMKFNEQITPLKAPLSGSTIYGYYDENGKTKIDSIVNNTLDSLEKQYLKTEMEQNQFEDKTPNKPMKVGDSVEKTEIVAFPVLGADEQVFLVKTKYTLQKIENGIGYLDATQTFKLKNPNEQVEVLPSSNGSGKVEFNIKHTYVSKKVTSANLHLKVKQDGYVMSCIISSNKSDITTASSLIR